MAKQAQPAIDVADKDSKPAANDENKKTEGQPSTRGRGMPRGSKRAATEEPPRRSHSAPHRDRKSPSEDSRSPRRNLPEDEDEAPSELSSISLSSWTKDVPGVGCSMETLRWYVIRAVGDLRQHAKETERVLNKHQISMQIQKGKVDDKMGKDQVKEIVEHAIVGKLEGTRAELRKFAEDVQGNFNLNNAKVASIEEVLTKHEIDKTRLDDTPTQLANFDVEIRKAFQQVEKVESDLVKHIGQEFGNLSSSSSEIRVEIERLKSKINSMNFQAPSASGGTSPPTAGAYDGQSDEHKATSKTTAATDNSEAEKRGEDDGHRGRGAGGHRSGSGCKVKGGSWPCHCDHLDELAKRVTQAEQGIAELHTMYATEDPWHRPRHGDDGKRESHGRGDGGR